MDQKPRDTSGDYWGYIQGRTEELPPILPLSEQKQRLEPVTLQEAIELMIQINKKLSGYGWIAALYGSVLTGKGRDVDLVVFNKGYNPHILAIITVMRQLGFTKTDESIGIFCTGIIFIKDGLVVDMQIRISSPNGEHSYKPNDL